MQSGNVRIKEPGTETVNPNGTVNAIVEIKDAVPVSPGSTKYSGVTPSGIRMVLYAPPPNHATIDRWRDHPEPD